MQEKRTQPNKREPLPNTTNEKRNMYLATNTAIHKGKFSGSPHGAAQDVDCDTDWCERQRLRTDSNSWRFSPHIPGLTTIKRAILAGYASHILSLRMAQRLIDATKSWEA